jgi:hypothetical protein
LEEEHGLPTVLKNEHEIIDVSRVGKSRDYNVTIDTIPASTTTPPPITANVIVIRHGIEPSAPPPLPRLFLRAVSLERNRHLMPCHVL